MSRNAILVICICTVLLAAATTAMAIYLTYRDLHPAPCSLAGVEQSKQGTRSKQGQSKQGTQSTQSKQITQGTRAKSGFTGTTIPELTSEEVGAAQSQPNKAALWALSTTCPHCVTLHARLKQLALAGKLKGLPMAGVVLRDQWPANLQPKALPQMFTVGGGELTPGPLGALSDDALIAELKKLR